MGTPSLAASVNDVDLPEHGIQQLIDEFVSRGVDESLICAIASDFNLPQDYEAARAILTPLAETAFTEEATGFDPSGLGHQSGSDSDLAHQISHELDDDASPVSGSHISTTDWTTVSETSEPTCFTSQTDLSEEEKIASLRVIFSNFQDHTLKYMLKDAGGDVEKAFDNLLSRQLLLEEGELVKGIDGFYVGDENARPGKASRHRERENKSGRTQLPVNYRLKPVAIESEDLQDPKPSKAWDVPTERYNPVSLSQRPLASSSRPLPNATTPKPNPTGWQVVSPRKKATTTLRSSESPSAYEPTHLLVSSNAQQAAALRRKGPLYQQAAAVYAGRSRADITAAHEAAYLSYQVHVNSQSSSRKIDLHGVPVLDGVKIARDRVRAWWSGLDERERERRKAANGNGLGIVTGLGNHSVSGVSRLRQAVAAMLRNDGWKFETLTGEFYVYGRN